MIYRWISNLPLPVSDLFTSPVSLALFYLEGLFSQKENSEKMVTGLESGFLNLAKFCWNIIDRLRNLKNVYQYITGEAGMLLMAFEKLHGCLQQFQGIPPTHLETLDTVRSNCHKTLTDVSNAIYKYEQLGNQGILSRGAKKTLKSILNEETEFRNELQRQINLVSPLVLFMQQYVVGLFDTPRRQSRQT
jgi:hypothetical protein